jgi:hypothetical protein
MDPNEQKYETKVEHPRKANAYIDCYELERSSLNERLVWRADIVAWARKLQTDRDGPKEYVQNKIRYPTRGIWQFTICQSG